MDFDWKALVGSLAPTIATALGGPLAGLGTKALVDALGLGEGAGEKDIAAALRTATPETIAAVRKADQEFELEMKRLDINLEEINARDRNSARQREAQTGDSWTPRVLAAVVVAGFFATVFAILFGYGVADSALAGALIGYVSAKAEQVVAYYFGSSAGSKAKTDAMVRAK